MKKILIAVLVLGTLGQLKAQTINTFEADRISSTITAQKTYLQSVGIGTAAGADKLTVQGNLSITGTVDGTDLSAHVAEVAASSSNINAGNITAGTLSSARLDSSSVTLKGNSVNGANQLVQLDGSTALPAVSGAALTTLNASQLTSGTVPNARLDVASVTLQGNAFNGASQLVQLNGSTQLPAVSGVNLTNLNASNLASGTIDNARLSASVSLLGQSIAASELDGASVVGISTNTGKVKDLTTASFDSVNGSAITALNASQLTSGTVPNARLDSSSVTLLGPMIDAAELPADGYAATYVNEGQASSITSAMITDGVVAKEDLNGASIVALSTTSGKVKDLTTASLDSVNASALTNLNASELATGTVPNARLDSSSVTLLGATIETTELPAAVALAGEGVAQFTNDAGYLTSASVINNTNDLQAGSTFYVSSGSVDGQTLLARTSGRVGIGTSSLLQAKLHIFDTAANQLKITRPDGDTQIVMSSGTAGVSPGTLEYGADGHWSLINSGATRFLIDANGNTGIGTSVPLEKLHVFGGGLIIDGSVGAERAATQIDFQSPGLARFIAGSLGAGTTMQFLTDDSAPGQNLVAKMTILPDGNIGVGTGSSTSKLHVRQEDGHNTTAFNARFENLETTNGQGQGVLIRSGVGASDDMLRVQNGAATVNAIVIDGTGATSFPDVNVGIGTAASGYDLDVMGTSTVRTGNLVNITPGQGAILTAPDGGCWKITVMSVTGALVSTSVTCP